MIKNLYTSLNSEGALVKLTDGVWWTYWCSGETELWGLVKLIDALFKLTDGVFWWGWGEVNLNRVWNGVFWWTGVGSTYGGEMRWYRVYWWSDVWLLLWGVTVIVMIKGLLMGGDSLINYNRVLYYKYLIWFALLMGECIMNWNMVCWWGNL